MQIWGCFANHQFGWTWRGRIMGSTFKLKMVDRRTKKAKLILVTIAITVGGVLFRASIPFSIENAKCRPILTYLGYFSYLGYLSRLSVWTRRAWRGAPAVLFIGPRQGSGEPNLTEDFYVCQMPEYDEKRKCPPIPQFWGSVPQWPRKRLTRSHM